MCRLYLSMKNFFLEKQVFFFLLIYSIIIPPEVLKADPISIRAKDLNLTVDPQKALITSISDNTGLEYTLAPGMPMILLNGKPLSNIKAFVKILKDGVRIEYHGALGDRGNVTATIKGSTESAGLTFLLDLDFQPGTKLKEVNFPALKLKPNIGKEPTDDFVFLPIGDGIEISRDSLRKVRRQKQFSYPGNASMQFLSFYDSKNGLCMMMKDTRGYKKALGYSQGSRPQKHMALFIAVKNPLDLKGKYKAAPVELFSSLASWENAARLYRPWALQQKWSQGSKKNQKHLPWLNKTDLLLEWNALPMGSGVWQVRPKDVSKYVKDMKSAIGSRKAIVCIRNFEKYGAYIMPDCEPFQAPLADVCKQVHRVGDRTYAMAGALIWCLKRKGYEGWAYTTSSYNGEQYCKDLGGADDAAITKNGTIKFQKQGKSTWKADSFHVCVGTKRAQWWMEHFAAELAKKGIDVLEWDQMHGGHAQECWSKKHGHPLGEGKWQSEAVHELFRLSREAGKKVNKNFALATEHICEFYMDVVDTYVFRPSHFSGWPAIGQGSRMVPAFSFVYHSVAPGMIIDYWIPPNFSPQDKSPEVVEFLRKRGWDISKSEAGEDMLYRKKTLELKDIQKYRVKKMVNFLCGRPDYFNRQNWGYKMAYGGKDHKTRYILPTFAMAETTATQFAKN